MKEPCSQCAITPLPGGSGEHPAVAVLTLHIEHARLYEPWPVCASHLEMIATCELLHWYQFVRGDVPDEQAIHVIEQGGEEPQAWLLSVPPHFYLHGVYCEYGRYQRVDGSHRFDFSRCASLAQGMARLMGQRIYAYRDSMCGPHHLLLTPRAPSALLLHYYYVDPSAGTWESGMTDSHGNTSAETGTVAAR